jgi:hypothetical protein
MEEKLNRSKKSLKDYAPQGTKDCESNCEREVILTPKGPVIVCHFCERVVREIGK